jgi:outer membrane protein assembly factor BamC
MSSPLRNPSRPALPLRTHERAVARAAAVALTALLVAGCGSLGGDTIDYRGTVVRAKPLDVPPDLTQLARDSRYQTQNGVVSAAASNVPTAAGAAPAATVAVATVANMRIERSGQQRWLVVPTAPEQLWPQLRAFWEARGFQIAMEDAKAGVIETNWSENRGKLPNDVVRNLLGRLAGNLFDTGERDQFRTRLERTEVGGKVSTEVFISHRGIEEAVLSPTGARDDNTTRWRLRPSDPQLEAEMLARLMVSLGGPQDVAAARTTVAAAPEAPARAPPSRSTSPSTAPGAASAWRWTGAASPSKTATALSACTTCATSTRRAWARKSRVSGRSCSATPTTRSRCGVSV